jgi:periplasmic divalent cation tolerance protein
MSASQADSARPPALIWCPFPDRDSARHIVKSMLDEGLVACANMAPGMISMFSWNGTIDEAEEVGVLLKTNSALLERAIARLEGLHPYDEPAILGWRCDAAAPKTAAWLAGLVA